MPLVGIMPFRERERLRDEARFNIDQLCEDYERAGLAERDATIKAIEKYGSADFLSQTFLAEWIRYRSTGPLTRKLGLANATAIVAFGLASFLAQGLVRLREVLVAPNPYTFGLSFAQVRRVIPEPIPLPERNALFWMMMGLLFVAPIVAGWIVGRVALLGVVRASYQVQILLVVFAFAAAYFNLPNREGFWVGFVQLLWWLPIGTLTAYIAALVERRRRLKFEHS